MLSYWKIGELVCFEEVGSVEESGAEMRIFVRFLGSLGRGLPYAERLLALSLCLRPSSLNTSRSYPPQATQSTPLKGRPKHAMISIFLEFSRLPIELQIQVWEEAALQGKRRTLMRIFTSRSKRAWRRRNADPQHYMPVRIFSWPTFSTYFAFDSLRISFLGSLMKVCRLGRLVALEH